MITTLARLHSVDWRSLGLSDFGMQTNYLRRQVSKTFSSYFIAHKNRYYLHMLS